MNYDEFIDEYKPIQNTIDTNASYDGMMFETFGEEVKTAFEAAKNNKCFTIIECDNEDTPFCDNDDCEGCEGCNSITIISTGFHYVNRLGFLITEKPYEKDFEVLDD